MNRQSQSAGENSTQILATRDVVIGVTEDRARSIAENAAREVIDKYADESVHIIQDRISKLDDRIIASLIREGRLEVFADPGFQRSYKRAQEGAAVSEREDDYDLLSGLLVDRAARGKNRSIRAGVERSIEIVDQIDDEALRGLTVFQALLQYSPTSPYVADGLDVLENLFADLVDGELPLGEEWLDHLDILDAVRINQVSTLKPFREFFPRKMSGYLASGQSMDVDEYPLVLNVGPFQISDLICEHELRPGYFRFAVASEATLAESQLPEPLVQDLLEQARSKMGFGAVEESLVDPFFEMVRSRPALAQLETWWMQIPSSPQLTAVGRVLARANARRLDVRNVLPSIE